MQRVRNLHLRRVGYGAIGLFFFAFAIFEMVKHGSITTAAGIFAVVAPFMGTLSPRSARWYNALHRLVGPTLILLWFSIKPPSSIVSASGMWAYLMPSTIADAAAGFTFGLAWFAHICVGRAFGFGLRTDDRRQVLGTRPQGMSLGWTHQRPRSWISPPHFWLRHQG